MFGKIFKKKAVEEIDRKTNEIEFVGEISGDGRDAVRMELAQRLMRFSSIKNAYLSRIKHASEDSIRIGLIVDGDSVTHDEKREIAQSSSGLIPLDVMFINDLSKESVLKITTACVPLFMKEMKLFECPMIVEKGHNTEMPEQWERAIVFFFVAAPDHESALLRAAEYLRKEGYFYKGVHERKVNQLDPERWSSGYVGDKWNAYIDHLPTQEQIKIMVLVGGYYRGPALQWFVGENP